MKYRSAHTLTNGYVCDLVQRLRTLGYTVVVGGATAQCAPKSSAQGDLSLTVSRHASWMRLKRVSPAVFEVVGTSWFNEAVRDEFLADLRVQSLQVCLD
jgi:hypothetical protein